MRCPLSQPWWWKEFPLCQHMIHMIIRWKNHSKLDAPMSKQLKCLWDQPMTKSYWKDYKNLDALMRWQPKHLACVVAERDPIGLNGQSGGSAFKKLQDMGCSCEAIAKAISLCGENTHISDLFDFIQASQYPIGDEVCPLDAPAFKEDVPLDEVGFSQRHLSDALRDCCESSILARTEFTPARYANEDKDEVADVAGDHRTQPDMNELEPKSLKEPSDGINLTEETRGQHKETIAASVNVRHLVGVERDLNGPNTESSGSPARQLKEMGCSCEDIAKAISLCGYVFDRRESSEAHHGNKDKDDGAEVVGHDERKSDAAHEPAPIDLEERSADINLTEETMVAEKGPVGFNKKADESSIELLHAMGCSSEDIALAISVCGENGHVLDLFDFIQASQVPVGDEDIALNIPAFEEDVPSNAEGFAQGHISEAVRACGKENFNMDVLDFIQAHYPNRDERNHISGSPLIFPTAGAGPSKRMAQKAKWNKVQKKKETGFFKSAEKEHYPFESREKDHDPFKSAWEDFEDEKRNNFDHHRSSLPQERKMGFGIPGQLNKRPRPLPDCMQGPPFFYFENVALVIDDAWNTIKLHFNGVEPEFVDSKYFSATRRQRGYVHNLPVINRKLVLPLPPMTILEALPQAQKYWPHWDTREKMNCIRTKGPALKSCNSVRSLLSNYEGMEVPDEVQQLILKECKEHNLLWVGPNELASLEVREIETLLGFDIDHTRGCSSMTDRYEMLGNSFQINTVAYHLSTLQSLFPKGITVLSLFTGIGGAEVALDKLGLFLKRVVVVEKVEKTRDVFLSWWKKSGQKGELFCKYHDVKELTYEVLTELIDEVGKIDLVIGGSPCNNLSGNNRWSRNGLNGTESSLFFEFPRILNSVKKIMEERGFSL